MYMMIMMTVKLPDNMSPVLSLIYDLVNFYVFFIIHSLITQERERIKNKSEMTEVLRKNYYKSLNL